MTDAPEDTRDQAAARNDATADQLERAARHLRTAARHYRDREISRGCAHAWATHGHIRPATARIDENAVLHASKASV